MMSETPLRAGGSSVCVADLVVADLVIALGVRRTEHLDRVDQPFNPVQHRLPYSAESCQSSRRHCRGLEMLALYHNDMSSCFAEGAKFVWRKRNWNGKAGT